jgi:CheY-like chemotaxis protein
MTAESSEKPLEILLVEDNPGDARLAEETLKQSEHATNITIAEDGEVALAHLRGEGEHAGSPRPDLILLDLQLPKKDGMEVLADLGTDPDLRRIPVVILTGTEAERSLLQSSNVPPSRYWKKPLDVNRFNLVVSQLRVFSEQPIQLPGAQAASASQHSEGGRKWWWPFG